ncbi:MAG: dihydropteroate synthase [Deltaproteobacteria bacterium]|nr:MAG: dihydropteroate synthase [Deltaproteobacteria bacterium]
MLIIGEKINASRKPVAEALGRRDTAFITGLAKQQVEAGADYIDLNVATGSGSAEEEVLIMEWAVETLQASLETPLTLDSSNPKVIAAGLRKHKNGVPMINSVSAEPEKMESLLPLAKEFDALIVALAMGKEGIPADDEGRLQACRQVHTRAQALGIQPGKLYYDPLVLSIATDTRQGELSLKTISRIKAELPGAMTTMGLSNVSFGLPERSLLNRVFLAMAITFGLDSAIIDPTDRELMQILTAAQALIGKDPYCKNYIKAYRKSRK